MQSTRTYAIADVHGRYDLFRLALEKIEASGRSGTVIFLGDYIDRGLQSREVIEHLIAGPKPGWTWICLKGNHEEMMIRAHAGVRTADWLMNGGSETLESYDGPVAKSHISWCERLPLLHVDQHRVYVHAAVDSTRPPDPQVQAASTLLWKRYGDDENPSYEYHVVHGHTPFANGPVCLSGRTNLDVGAVYYGRLSIGVFGDEIPGGPIAIWSV